MTQEAKDLLPETDPDKFNLEDWIAGGERAMRAVTIYARVDLMAEIDRIEREIEIEENLGSDVDADRSVAEPSRVVELEEQLEAVMEAFRASGRVFKVKALTGEERKAIEDAHKEACEKKDHDEDCQVQLGSELLAAAIVEPTGVTPNLVIRMNRQFGDAQIEQLTTAMNNAARVPPSVMAPFSRPSSTRDGGRPR